MFRVLQVTFPGDTITSRFGIPRHLGIALVKLAGIAPMSASAGAV